MKSLYKYEVYDGEQCHTGFTLPVYEAHTAKDAIMQRLKETGRDYKLKRSANNDCIFSAMKLKEYRGELRTVGNEIWYAVVGRN